MYYRYLKQLESEHVHFISSTKLAELAGLTASQVRQDMSAFGGEGRQGSGYPISELRKHLERLLGIDKQHAMIIIGAGNLGCALAHYHPFHQKRFSTLEIFDNDPSKIGTTIGSFTIKSTDALEAFLSQRHVDIAVLTLPATHAQQIAERVYNSGVRAFWNFAPVDLKLPQDASIVSVHLDESLEMLSYYMLNKDG